MRPQVVTGWPARLRANREPYVKASSADRPFRVTLVTGSRRSATPREPRYRGRPILRRVSPTSDSMNIVQLHLGHGAGHLAIDPIRALAQQVAGEQPLALLAGDDFPRRWLALGNHQRRALVFYSDIEVEFVEACLDLAPFRHISYDLE